VCVCVCVVGMQNGGARIDAAEFDKWNNEVHQAISSNIESLREAQIRVQTHLDRAHANAQNVEGRYVVLHDAVVMEADATALVGIKSCAEFLQLYRLHKQHRGFVPMSDRVARDAFKLAVQHAALAGRQYRIGWIALVDRDNKVWAHKRGPMKDKYVLPIWSRETQQTLMYSLALRGMGMAAEWDTSMDEDLILLSEQPGAKPLQTVTAQRHFVDTAVEEIASEWDIVELVDHWYSAREKVWGAAIATQSREDTAGESQTALQRMYSNIAGFCVVM
jgi:hypothetical protein